MIAIKHGAFCSDRVDKSYRHPHYLGMTTCSRFIYSFNNSILYIEDSVNHMLFIGDLEPYKYEVDYDSQ